MRLCWLGRQWSMKNGLAYSSARAIVGTEALADLRGSVGAGATGGDLGWAAGGAHTNRDPDSDRRMVQRVRALYHSTAFGRITQTECGGRARHLEGTHMEQEFTYHEKTQDRENRHAEAK